MAVVNTRENLLWAKEIIVRWWRGQKERRRKPISRMAEARQRIEHGTRHTRAELIKKRGGNIHRSEVRADTGKDYSRAQVEISLDRGDHGDTDLWLNL
jgi:hypothetical protein